jgi:ketosteroid isomerase-like protein
LKRPGAGLNAAVLPDQSAQGTIVLETLMRLDLLYPEASAPFGLGVAYPLAAGGQTALLFGFVGTRRIDTLRDPARSHLTELAFYEVNAQNRAKLGKEILKYRDASSKAYKLGNWYHIKLAVEEGLNLKGKVWPQGMAEPEWMYSVVLDSAIPGPAVPLLAASTSTNGEAAFEYFLVSRETKSQSNNSAAKELSDKIASLDSDFFAAFDSCDLAKVESLFTEELEFYHQKAGFTATRTSTIATMKKNLCEKDSNRVRRELIKGTLEVYPVGDYGAVQTGEHRFYLTLQGQKEKLDGVGKFVHIWQKTNDQWKISRVISYGLRPAE